MGRGEADRWLGTGEAALYRDLPGRVRATRARSVRPASVRTYLGPLSDHENSADSVLVGGAVREPGVCGRGAGRNGERLPLFGQRGERWLNRPQDHIILSHYYNVAIS